MLLEITHLTRYSYSPAVESAQHVAHLKPRQQPSQTLVSHSLVMTPACQTQPEVLDAFGNSKLFFELHAPHDFLSVCATSRLLTHPQSMPPELLLTRWQWVCDHFSYQAGHIYEPAVQYLFPSNHVPLSPVFGQYARRSFAPHRPLIEACAELTQRIHEDFEYVPDSTHVNTPALKAFEQRQGVCQDFAHIMLGCLRSIGLPACYVSGYLLTHPPEGQERLIGSDASHAWVSIFVPPTTDQPDGSWVDFDPTNNRFGWRSPGEDFVCLAHGRDFSDVSPLRGVIQGGASHQLEVEVTVMPLVESSNNPQKPVAPLLPPSSTVLKSCKD